MKKILNQIATILLKYRLMLIWFVILLIFGILLIKMQKISNYKSDKIYLEKQRENSSVKKLNIDKTIIDKLESLEETRVNVEPKKQGTQDPFRP